MRNAGASVRVADIARPFFHEAVREFWGTRKDQAKAQGKSGQQDYGARRDVTGGRQMDGFARALRQALSKSGLLDTCIFEKTAVELPGYFRATKKWDLVVVRDGHLLAAIELKSQVGP